MSNDLISRQAAIKAICEDGTWLERQGCTDISMAERKQRDVDILSDLPSVQPEQKKGRWLFTDAIPHRVYCSACYKTYVPNKEWIAWAEDIIPKNFCPNCGAEMEEEK